MLETALPAFDFIVLHGVYSWVSEAVRGEIRASLEAKLKPGGLVMVSYNAMPGWAHLQPIRRMMQTYAGAVTGDSTEKARAAFAYVDFLAKNGAEYFATLPAAASHLKEIATHDIRYVAHEYLTPHANPFYFSEVEQGMRSVGLSFAGSMTPAENYAELMAPPQFRGLLADAPTRAVVEMHRDFIVNTRFRRDLYAAQPDAGRVPVVPLEGFDALAFCLADVPERLQERHALAVLDRGLGIDGAATQALYGRLEAGPATAFELHRATRGGSHEATSLLLQKLVAAGHVLPCPPLRAAGGWSKANTALVEAGISEQCTRIPLACPVTGMASYSEVIYASVIEAAAQFKDVGDAADSVLARLRAHGHPIGKRTANGDKQPATDDEVREYVACTWRSLSDASSADARRLRLLGILA